jgi:hypothetical protein
MMSAAEFASVALHHSSEFSSVYTQCTVTNNDGQRSSSTIKLQRDAYGLPHGTGNTSLPFALRL